MQDENTIILYQDENGKTNVTVRFAEEDVWVTQVQLAEIYQTTRQNIGQHIENIFTDNELARESTIKKFFIVQSEDQIDEYKNALSSWKQDSKELFKNPEDAEFMQHAFDNISSKEVYKTKEIW